MLIKWYFGVAKQTFQHAAIKHDTQLPFLPHKLYEISSTYLCFADIRLQLNEQLRCLDIRVESQISLIQELQEFYR